MSSAGSGGRDRDKNRKYVSGAAKRKAREERVSRESKALSKVPKISELFSPKSSGGNEIGSSVDVVSDFQPQQNDEGASGESTISTAAMSTTMTDSVPQPHNISTESLPSDDSASFSTDASEYSCDLGFWPASVSDRMREYWAAKGSSQCRNSDADFCATSTRFEGESYNRQCQRSLFTYTHELTKQQHCRTWLCYSPSKHAVFCFACKLMTESLVFGKQGYKDWKRASQSIPRHEKSAVHREAMIKLLQRSAAGCRVDVELVRQANAERDYWRAVLERITETIRYLSERGLPFRGSDEVIGSPKNGNYLGTLELIAMFDPFLAQHINHNANKGRGHTSYLSKTICEEFIHLMANRVREHIIREVKSAKYFSVSVDSTPDITHVDQLTCILRYVLPSGPVERFLTFLDMKGHSGKELAESLLKFLKTHDIDVADCRGQSYDNASNMSGKYNGMQAIIRQQCNLAEYVPCAAHSLNLVGQSAVGCCQLVVGFFNFVQRLYSFFVPSTHRWKILTDQLSSKSRPTVKRMSDTRWSARADATKALVEGYDEINAALEEIADDVEENPDTREEARGLASYMNRLETGILAAVWHHILHRFHENSQVLQSADQDLNSAVAIYESLIEFISKMRERFEEFEAKGKKLCECNHFVEDNKRVRQRNRRYDEPGSAPELPQTPADKFRTGTFLVIIDSLDAGLRKRLGAYTGIAERFGFLRKLKDLPVDQVIQSAKKLQKSYPTDLEASLSDELVQFSGFLNTEFAKKSLDAITPSAVPENSSAQAMIDTFPDESDDDDLAVITKDDDDVRLNVESLEMRIYRLIVANNLETVFPNTLIVFRIYLSLMISNCSGERSFSKLKLIKSQLRSCMIQKRLNSLTLLSIENNLLRNIDMSSLINDFALQKSRKHDVYKAFAE